MEPGNENVTLSLNCLLLKMLQSQEMVLPMYLVMKCVLFFPQDKAVQKWSQVYIAYVALNNNFSVMAFMLCGVVLALHFPHIT